MSHQVGSMLILLIEHLKNINVIDKFNTLMYIKLHIF